MKHVWAVKLYLTLEIEDSAMEDSPEEIVESMIEVLEEEIGGEARVLYGDGSMELRS